MRENKFLTKITGFPLIYVSLLGVILGFSIFYGLDGCYYDIRLQSFEADRKSPEIIKSAFLPINSSTSTAYSIQQPILTDIDGDGVQDIIAVTNDDSQLNIWNGSGFQLPGWPQQLKKNCSFSDPVVMAKDFLQNGSVELLIPLGVSVNRTDILVFDSTGTLLQNHSVSLNIYESPPKLYFLASTDISPPQVYIWSRTQLNQSVGYLIIPKLNTSRALTLPITQGSLVSVLPVKAPGTNFWELYFMIDTGEVYKLALEGETSHTFTHSSFSNTSTLDAVLFLFPRTSDDLNPVLLCLNQSGSIFGWNLAGLELSSWTLNISHPEVKWNENYPIFGDINGDGYNEILLVGDRGLFYILNSSGQLVPHWSRSYHSFLAYTHPLLVDTNYDGIWEISLVEYGYAFSSLSPTSIGFYNINGTLLFKWFENQELKISLFQKPVVGDVTGDRYCELILVCQKPDEAAQIVIIQTNWLGVRLWPFPPSIPSTCYLNDSDHDGIIDRDETLFHTNPQDPDSDQDGLLDSEEIGKWGTDPLNPNCDNDTVFDGKEVEQGDNPIFYGDNSAFLLESFYFSIFLPNRKIMGRIFIGLGIGLGIVGFLLKFGNKTHARS